MNGLELFSWFIMIFLLGILIGLIIGILCMESYIRKKYYLVLRNKKEVFKKA